MAATHCKSRSRSPRNAPLLGRSADAAQNADSGMVNVTVVSSLTGGTIVRLTLRPESLIVTLRKAVNESLLNKRCRIKLMHGEHELRDEETVEATSLENGATIEVLKLPLLVLTASEDGYAKVFDSQSGLCIGTCSGHRRAICKASFSHDGLKIVTASADWTAKIFDSKHFRCERTFRGHTSDVVDVCFSKDNCYIVTASHDCSAKLFRVQDGTCVRTFAHDDMVIRIDISMDSSQLLTVSGNETLHSFQVSSGKQLSSYHADHVFEGYALRDALFTKTNGRRTRLRTKAKSRNVKVWAATGGPYLHLLNLETGVVEKKIEVEPPDDTTGHLTTTCELSPDGSYFFVATEHVNMDMEWNGPSKLIDAKTGTCLRTFDDEGGLHGKFSPDGTQVVVACENGTAKIYGLTEPPWSMVLKGHSDAVNSAEFSPCY